MEEYDCEVPPVTMRRLRLHSLWSLHEYLSGLPAKRWTQLSKHGSRTNRQCVGAGRRSAAQPFFALRMYLMRFLYRCVSSQNTLASSIVDHAQRIGRKEVDSLEQTNVNEDGGIRVEDTMALQNGWWGDPNRSQVVASPVDSRPMDALDSITRATAHSTPKLSPAISKIANTQKPISNAKNQGNPLASVGLG